MTDTPLFEKAVFHIGDHKTGSTILQSALATGAIKYENASICYPAHPISMPAFNHNNMFSAWKRGMNSPARDHLNKVCTQIKEEAADITIFSSEELEGAPPSFLQYAILSHFNPLFKNIDLIMYVRPHAGRILSGCTERIKGGGYKGDSLDQFFEMSARNSVFEYMPRINRWKETFADQLHIIAFHPSHLQNESILDDFCSRALPDKPYEIDLSHLPDTAKNSSTNLLDLMVMKLIHTSLPDLPKPIRNGLGYSVARGFARQSPPMPDIPLHLHRSLAMKIHERYKEDAVALDDTFFFDAPVMLKSLERAIDEAPNDEQSLKPEAYFTESERRIILSMAYSMGEMLCANVGWGKHFRSVRINDLHGRSTQPED